MKSAFGTVALWLPLCLLACNPGVASAARAVPVPAGNTTSASAPARDPIAYAGHGALFGQDHEQITSVTPEFLATALAHYTARALAASTPSQRTDYEQKRKFVHQLTDGDQAARQMAEALLAQWLVDQAQPADAAYLIQRINTVKSQLQQRSAGGIDDFRRAMLAQAGLLAAAPAAAGALPAPPFAVAQAREAYLKRCKDAGVPIPPDWGKNGAGEWSSKSTLTRTFIIPGNTAEVYVHESSTPVGVCLALPRYKPGAATDIEQLGIICMGKGKADTSGKVVSAACFWDNQVNKKSVNVGRNTPVPLANFAAGEELKDGEGEVCTMCHAGENAFIIHPDQAAMRNLPNLAPDAYYTPLVHAAWPQNKTPNTKLGAVAAPQKSCLDCHDASDAGRLPEITKEINGFCGAVVLPSIRLTMPPGPGAKPNDKYKQHIKTIVDECTKANAP